MAASLHRLLAPQGFANRSATPSLASVRCASSVEAGSSETGAQRGNVRRSSGLGLEGRTNVVDSEVARIGLQLRTREGELLLAQVFKGFDEVATTVAAQELKKMLLGLARRVFTGVEVPCCPLVMNSAFEDAAREVTGLSIAAAMTIASLGFPQEALAVAMESGEMFRVSAAEIDPSTAKLAITILGPLLAAFNLMFIVRIVMSWYPQLPVGKFPFSIAYAPTEPVLGPTRRLIPPVGGVDVAPVIWVAVMSFLNEILLGQQGLLVLLSQQQP